MSKKELHQIPPLILVYFNTWPIALQSFSAERILSYQIIINRK